MLKPCKNGHDRNVVGVNKWRACNACAQEHNRIKAQERRRRAKTLPGYPDPPKRVKPVRDGLEALYGPVPDLVPDSAWYDDVIVLRALNKQPCGRTPTPLEWEAILDRMGRAGLLDEDVAESTRTTAKYVSEKRKALHERRSFLLATGGV